MSRQQGGDVIRGALKETLSGRAARSSVPCLAFDVGAIKRRYAGRVIASKADLAASCNESLGANLEPGGCDVTGVDRVAVAALGLLAGLEGNAVGTGPNAGARA